MVVWLYVSEVITIASGETIVSVKLEDGVFDRTYSTRGVGDTGSEVEMIVIALRCSIYICPY